MSISKAASMMIESKAAAEAARAAKVDSGAARHERAPRRGEEPGRGVSRMVDAPGKQHRKPPPQEAINKRLGEPVGKQMGQKRVKNNMRRGRG
jgi:hypothetical protein